MSGLSGVMGLTAAGISGALSGSGGRVGMLTGTAVAIGGKLSVGIGPLRRTDWTISLPAKCSMLVCAMFSSWA